MIKEVLIFVVSAAVAAALVALGGAAIVSVGDAAWKISEYRALYILPTMYVYNGQVYLCFNSTYAKLVAALNATDGAPLAVTYNYYIANGGAYCAAWIGPLKPGDKITLLIQGQTTSRAITIQINSISAG